MEDSPNKQSFAFMDCVLFQNYLYTCRIFGRVQNKLGAAIWRNNGTGYFCFLHWQVSLLCEWSIQQVIKKEFWIQCPGGLAMKKTEFFFSLLRLKKKKRSPPFPILLGFPSGSVVKNPPTKQEMQVRSLGWKWQRAPVFLPGKVHGQRNLAGNSPWGHKRTGRALAIKQQQPIVLKEWSRIVGNLGKIWKIKARN